jgi:hypothetical protein
MVKVVEDERFLFRPNLFIMLLHLAMMKAGQGER